MTDTTTLLTPAEIAATRSLIGLNADQLSKTLQIGSRTVPRWETGALRISDSAATAVLDLRAQHDRDLSAAEAKSHGGTKPITLPRGTAERPASWWVAIAARLVDRHPNIEIHWA